MPGFEDVVTQILAFTRFDANPKQPQPGELITLETVPGLFPIIPAQLVGQLSIPGLMGGNVPVSLESLVKTVKFTVRYRLEIDGKDQGGLTIDPLTAASLPDSDPLAGLLRIAPPLVPEHAAKPTVPANLIAKIHVEIEDINKDGTLDKEIPIPLTLVPITVPTLLVLQSDPDDPDWASSKTFVMTRLGSQLQSASDAVAKLNDVVQVVNSVKDILDPGLAVDALLGGLGDTLAMINKAGFSIAGFAVDEAPDLDDYDDFDDEARKSLLLGPVGTKVQFFSGEDYNALVGGENEVSTFEIRPADDFGAVAGLTMGFGINKELDWFHKMWDTDSSDNMNDVESCKFVN
jgi:hypothetical protein